MIGGTVTCSNKSTKSDVFPSSFHSRLQDETSNRKWPCAPVKAVISVGGQVFFQLGVGLLDLPAEGLQLAEQRVLQAGRVVGVHPGTGPSDGGKWRRRNGLPPAESGATARWFCSVLLAKVQPKLFICFHRKTEKVLEQRTEAQGGAGRGHVMEFSTTDRDNRCVQGHRETPDGVFMAHLSVMVGGLDKTPWSVQPALQQRFWLKDSYRGETLNIPLLSQFNTNLN